MIHKYIKIINYVIFKVHLIFQLFSKSIQKVNRQIIRVNLQNDTKLYCVSFKCIYVIMHNMVTSINYKNILNTASTEIFNLIGQDIDVLTLHKPKNIDQAKQIIKIISKLSPLLGNNIEFAVVEELNKYNWNNVGKWVRQDPGFPDVLFESDVKIKPGIEIKTWFPLATEITARFKDSVSHFNNEQVNVALVVWLPEHLIWGKPKIIDVWVDSALSIAKSRDLHYFNPPDYLVVEPDDTSERTINLQQTNTNGFKFQGTKLEFEKAKEFCSKLGINKNNYSNEIEYQSKIKSLFGQYKYRLDTNFAKIDRIEHTDLEIFKQKVLNTEFCGMQIQKWARLINNDNSELEKAIKDYIL